MIHQKSLQTDLLGNFFTIHFEPAPGHGFPTRDDNGDVVKGSWVGGNDIDTLIFFAHVCARTVCEIDRGGSVKSKP